jgi:hypothetical protein
MRQPVLGAAVQRKRVTREETHGLASACDRNMQGAVVVRGSRILVRVADIGHRGTVGMSKHMNAFLD